MIRKPSDVDCERGSLEKLEDEWTPRAQFKLGKGGACTLQSVSRSNHNYLLVSKSVKGDILKPWGKIPVGVGCLGSVSRIMSRF